MVELWWEYREAMEAAWESEAGRRATDDLAAFADLEASSWSLVDEIVAR